MEIPRKMEFDARSEIAAVVMTILGIRLQRADGIALFTGEGERHRVLHGVNLWNRDYGRLFLVTGDSEQTSRSFGETTKKEITDLCHVEENCPEIFKQERADHTGEQANWVAGLAVENQVESLIVTASLYHLPRVFLTLLKCLQRKNQKILLIPSPARPVQFSREWLLIPGEVERIVRYQEKGDVATAQELYSHLLWQLSGQ